MMHHVHRPKKYPQNLKILLFSILLCSLALVVGIFVAYRFFSDRPEALLTVMDKQGDLSISSIHHTAIRNGVTEWVLEAESANVVTSEKKAVLKEVKVTFLLKDMTEVKLSAAHGILDYQTNDIEVNGGVVITRETHTLKTESLFYNHHQHRFFSNVPVEISGESLRLVADSMSFDLNSQKSLFDGHVQTIFNEKNIL